MAMKEQLERLVDEMVTKGVRYAYLPFLYGAADAALRERNKDFVEARSGGRAPVR